MDDLTATSTQDLVRELIRRNDLGHSEELLGTFQSALLHDPAVRAYRLVLRDDDRLDSFDMEVVVRQYLARFGYDLLSLRPLDGRPSYGEIQAREMSFTPEDEAEIADMLRSANPVREVVSICTECGATRKQLFRGDQRVSTHTDLPVVSCVDHDWMDES